MTTRFYRTVRNMVCWLWLGLLLSPPTGAALDKQEPEPKTLIHAGDYLNIQVYREADLSGVYPVDAQGSIFYPLLGDIHTEGLTLEALEKNLADALGKDYLVDPKVKVGIEKSLNKSISILGQITKPGNYDFRPDLTIVKLVSEAGGFTPLSVANKLKIVRLTRDGKKKTLIVNVNRIMAGKADDMQLESGDLIVVPEALF